MNEENEDAEDSPAPTGEAQQAAEAKTDFYEEFKDLGLPDFDSSDAQDNTIEDPDGRLFYAYFSTPLDDETEFRDVKMAAIKEGIPVGAYGASQDPKVKGVVFELGLLKDPANKDDKMPWKTPTKRYSEFKRRTRARMQALLGGRGKMNKLTGPQRFSAFGKTAPQEESKPPKEKKAKTTKPAPGTKKGKGSKSERVGMPTH